jgi:Resolvase, N terminal domain
MNQAPIATNHGGGLRAVSKRAALYMRVSTKNHGQTTETQALALREFAEHRGFDIVEEYRDEGISGSKDSRPALDRLMKDAKVRKFDLVIVARFDRFARSVSHLLRALEEFSHLGVDFVNGRVARAVASVFSYRTESVPLLVFAESRTKYFAALGSADTGQNQPFVDFVKENLVGAIQLVYESIATASVTAVEDMKDKVEQMLMPKSGHTHQQLWSIRLQDETVRARRF